MKPPSRAGHLPAVSTSHNSTFYKNKADKFGGLSQKYFPSNITDKRNVMGVSMYEQQAIMQRKVVFDHRQKYISTIMPEAVPPPLRRQNSLEEMFAKFIPTLKPVNYDELSKSLEEGKPVQQRVFRNVVFNKEKKHSEFSDETTELTRKDSGIGQKFMKQLLPPIDKVNLLKTSVLKEIKQKKKEIEDPKLKEKIVMKQAVEEYEKKRMAKIPPFMVIRTEKMKKKKGPEEELDEQASFMTEDEEYVKEQRDKAERRVKFQLLIEEMIIHKDYFIPYLDRNKRSLSISTYDFDTFQQLLSHVAQVLNQPQSRYFQVLNLYLTQNPDLTTRLKIALERMYEEKKQIAEEEKREEIMKERRQLAIAVCEAAYQRIKMAIKGELVVPVTPGAKEETKRMINLGDEMEVSENEGKSLDGVKRKSLKRQESRLRQDPLTRFKSDLLQSTGGMNLSTLGDLAERSPFYLVKKTQDYVYPPSSGSEEGSEKEEESPPKPEIKEEEKLLGQKYLEVKGEEFTNPELQKPPPPIPKKKRRLSKEPRPERLDKFTTPDKQDPNSKLDYDAREYYGAIPLDGELYSTKLNSASKKFVITYLHGRFERAIEQHQPFDHDRNDIDFREIVKMIMEAEDLVDVKKRLKKAADAGDSVVPTYILRPEQIMARKRYIAKQQADPRLAREEEERKKQEEKEKKNAARSRQSTAASGRTKRVVTRNGKSTMQTTAASAKESSPEPEIGDFRLNMKWTDEQQKIKKQLNDKGSFKSIKGSHKPMFKTAEEEAEQVKLWLDILNDSPIEPQKPNIIHGSQNFIANQITLQQKQRQKNIDKFVDKQEHKEGRLRLQNTNLSPEKGGKKAQLKKNANSRKSIKLEKVIDAADGRLLYDDDDDETPRTQKRRIADENANANVSYITYPENPMKKFRENALANIAPSNHLDGSFLKKKDPGMPPKPVKQKKMTVQEMALEKTRQAMKRQLDGSYVPPAVRLKQEKQAKNGRYKRMPSDVMIDEREK
ncbi:hypothetical protein FGO68_gene4222 [Halteria grandinella]|uniref:Uncharacterized protein n=1 Tax=Halteria grandinella TaxID=5974 RepID=A0A8J8P1K7_HALGN|nr:hypothetical protein FGO68_gene4222 [Halteria grandinella]